MQSSTAAEAEAETPSRKDFFSDKLCVITGGASGIGEATAALLSERGAKVAIVDVNDVQGGKFAARLGVGASYHHCDITSEAAVEQMLKEVHDHHQRPLHVFINSAGIVGALGPIDEMDAGRFDTTLAVNLRGTFLGIKHAARAMKRAGVRGAVVNLASVGGVRAGLAAAAYTASKFAVVGLTQQAACELAPHGIRVNSVAPSGTDTPMIRRHLHKGVDESVASELQQMQTFPHAMTAEDVANTIVYLASDQAAAITGHNLVVDCGQLTGFRGSTFGDFSVDVGRYQGTVVDADGGARAVEGLLGAT